MSGGAGAAIGATPTSIDRCEQAFVLEIQKRLKVGIGLQHHVCTMPTISAAGRTTGRDILPSEGDDAVTSAPAPDGDACLIDELHETLDGFSHQPQDRAVPEKGFWQAFGLRHSARAIHLEGNPIRSR